MSKARNRRLAPEALQLEQALNTANKIAWQWSEMVRPCIEELEEDNDS